MLASCSTSAANFYVAARKTAAVAVVVAVDSSIYIPGIGLPKPTNQ